MFFFILFLFSFSLCYQIIYCKILKISLGAYIFQRPFLRGLFLKGLMFGGAYLRREICVSKPIGLALQFKEIYRVFCFTLYLRAISKDKPPEGAYIWRGDLREVFGRYEFGGLVFGGAYTWRGLFSEFYGMSYYVNKCLSTLFIACFKFVNIEVVW